MSVEPMTRVSYTRITRAMLLALGVLGLALTGQPVPVRAQSAYKMLVGVDSVRRVPLSQTVPVIGRLVAKRAGRIAAPMAGAVLKVHVEVGDHVKAGSLLAELDVATVTARLAVTRGELAQARAGLDEAKAALALARQEFSRQQRLKRSGAFSRSRLDTTSAQLLKAKAGVARARAIIVTKKAALAVQQIEIGKARITSPYTGVVVERFTHQGAYVRGGDPVVRLVSDRGLEIEAAVPSVRMGGLSPGKKVVAILDDGTRFSALVRAALPIENPLTRTRPVRFTPLWPKGITRLADAQTVTVYLPVGAARDVLSVHKDAIVRQRGQDIVFVVTKGKAERRQVTLGVATGSRIEVTAGLKIGDLAVVRGNERLRPGTAVRVNKGS